MEFGVHLPLISFAGEQRSLADLLAFTDAARDLGYTHLCVNDHLVFSRPWLDGPTVLAAVLAHSGQMTLATTIAVPALRGPAGSSCGRSPTSALSWRRSASASCRCSTART